MFIILVSLINWGWLRIGPPYIYININPIIVQIGPLALRWYGLMYAVGILVGIWAIRGYATKKGIDQNLIYRLLWWCIPIGLIGGRLYFVVQQPDLVSNYLGHPINIIATWEGGMAFFGAIFLVIPTLFWRARVEKVNPLVLIDAGVLFAVVGQIFGRIGNLINGDIIGFPSTLPWSTVYQNANSWACLNPATCNVPVQPAAGYEMLSNIALLILMFYLASRVRRPGVLMLVYLFSYCITQFSIFFVRDNLIVSFLGLNWGLKQAQWTSMVVFLFLIPLSYLVYRYAKPVPAGEVALTYGIADREEEAEEEADVDAAPVDEETAEPALKAETLTSSSEDEETEDAREALETPEVAKAPPETASESRAVQ